MIYGIVIILVSYFLAYRIIDKVILVTNRKTQKSSLFLKNLFWYHLFLSVVYYVYALFNFSDSLHYYLKIVNDYRGTSWSHFYGTSTIFIEWFGYPFIKYFGFTYEAMMVLFSFFGFLGFVYFYKFFKERIRFSNKILGYDLLTLFFLLPNLHFWSGSFGKGSFIFLGIALIFYSLNSVKNRWTLLILGSLITYHIRPHIMFVILASSVVGFAFSNKGVGWGTRILMVLISALAFFFIYQDVLTAVGIDQGEELTQGLNLTNRARELSKATSGIDITEYSLPSQVFTFLFRPLFFDAPGMLGVIVSFENVFLLVLTILFIARGGIWHIIKGDFLIKTSFLSFITVSIALAQISGNLGIAIRQKSQVMILFLFVIITLFDNNKMKIYRQNKLDKLRRIYYAKKNSTILSRS
ncbi:MAG: hypothetical protein AAF363_14300 [Bacteroidota bacterium]